MISNSSNIPGHATPVSCLVSKIPFSCIENSPNTCTPSASPAGSGLCAVVCGFGCGCDRFVCVIRVPLCARVSRVCPVCAGSPQCLFTGSPPPVGPPRGPRRGVHTSACTRVLGRTRQAHAFLNARAVPHIDSLGVDISYNSLRCARHPWRHPRRVEAADSPWKSDTIEWNTRPVSHH